MKRDATIIQQMMTLAAKRTEAGVPADERAVAVFSPLVFLRRERKGKKDGRKLDEAWDESA